ncbi:TlpA disulfide reductase family protein [Sphingomonas sp.]|uniref:TlpA family protein disulfide reductase n=1 Tax=Sphingomonas sp. TaxID=28214 RepID=UPI002EDB4B03
MRSTIALLLLAALATGGCDRQSSAPRQAEEKAPAANAAASADSAQIDRSHKSEAAPAIPFADPAGKRVILADFAGRPVLVNLWATWCAPCVKEMPTLDALALAKGDALQVLTISQDLKGKEVVAPFFEKAKFKKLQPWLDTDIAWSMTLGANLPMTILYDAAGREVWRVSGEMDWMGAKAAALVAEAGGGK